MENVKSDFNQEIEKLLDFFQKTAGFLESESVEIRSRDSKGRIDKYSILACYLSRDEYDPTKLKPTPSNGAAFRIYRDFSEAGIVIENNASLKEEEILNKLCLEREKILKIVKQYIESLP
ncbi:MAG TPA: hypothetical protein VFQ59_02555 [Candidatus Paceibacterota bacterium]|nr:hypothetical protein [Candidatus Paceibacterota bacterium]